MSFFARLKVLVRRLRPGRPSTQGSEPNLEAAAPLVGLLDEAEPLPDLFARIERQLDAEMPAAPQRPQPAGVRRELAILGLGLFLGVAVAALVTLGLPPRQQIVARPAPTVVWSTLGEVTLHGRDLRAFVRARCRGYTHFYITMHGYADPQSAGDGVAEVPLMNPGEQILMECNF
ncbi:hypothetical protein AIOL_004381 [Candidatus Rhodobacter oscarellae]|uniref:Uncharacterized protein n=1 Tax=Candidatus Rhodobacter oscarellae TaxID=1675527 RepID=A0A0J9ECG1_9RHOB|nr:hypothetical protein [Candidatus Rhodobacter lobularis]KMW59399.1 hypothetical protein AIOL_004381 [Candidatus Rhodobacter lobularis]